jgi:hypothetical protein
MEQNKLLEAANTTLREDNAKLRKKVKDLEERTRGLSRSLAAREAEVATFQEEESTFRKKFCVVYNAMAVLADAVNGTTANGRLAKDAARGILYGCGVTAPSALATRTTKKARKKRTSKKKA